MEIPIVVLEVLNKCQELHPSYIVGGFLRDKLIGVEPTDIDISTECSIKELKKMFPRLTWTESGYEYGVSRVQYKGLNFEFSSHDKGTLLDDSGMRDFTINSLYHDGEALFDTFQGVEDIQLKLIKSLESPQTHFQSHPQAYLRALRLSCTLGFSIEPSLLDYMKNNQAIFFDNTTNRIQNEGYKILSSERPLYAFYYLMELGFLKKAEFDKEAMIPFLLDNLAIRLTYLSSIVGLESIEKFIDLFELSRNLIDKCHYFYQFLDDSVLPYKPTVINQVLLLKKYQYGGDIAKLKEYLLKINKKN